MLRSNLYRLLTDIRQLPVEGIPIIVGSQAVHAVTEAVPEIARQSVECGLLYGGGEADGRGLVNREVGVLTAYQDETGHYADAVGLATIVLPTGWEERLVPLEDGKGVLVAMCVEIHDVAVSKLIAGRQKDFEFIDSLLTLDLIDLDKFLTRLDLAAGKVENDTIKYRIAGLLARIRSADHHFETVRRLRHLFG